MAGEKVDTVTRVQLPEAGDGVELYLTVGDFRRLFNEVGEDYVSKIETGLNQANFEVFDKFLSIAAKRKGKPFPTKVDVLDMRLEDVRDRLRDAFTLSLAGLRYKDYLVKIAKDNRALTERLTGDKDDTPFLAAGSDNSTTERTGPDFSLETMNP